MVQIYEKVRAETKEDTVFRFFPAKRHLSFHKNFFTAAHNVSLLKVSYIGFFITFAYRNMTGNRPLVQK